MKFSLHRCLMIGLITLLSACASTGNLSASNYTSNWKGWESVLQIVVDTLTTEDGRQLVTMQEVQARNASLSPAATTADNGSSNVVVNPAQAASAMPTQSDIQITIFAKEEVRSVNLRNVPVDQNGVPTAESFNQILNAARAFRQQVFPEADSPQAQAAPTNVSRQAAQNSEITNRIEQQIDRSR